jgi:hypothetical protein
MTEQTEEQKRYNTPAADLDKTFSDEAKKVDSHEGQNKTTRSVEGSVEKTTTEKKP